MNINFSWTPVLLALGLVSVTSSIHIPFFGSFGGSRAHTQQPAPANHLNTRIINADHDVGNGGSASFAGGNYGPAPWISDQLIILHPDSPLNREAWKDSSYSFSDSELQKDIGVVTERMVPSVRTPPARVRKPVRKSKQQTAPPKTVSSDSSTQNQNEEKNVHTSGTQPQSQIPVVQQNGGLYEILPPPVHLFRDLGHNQNGEQSSGDDDAIIIQEPVYLGANNLLFPVQAPIFPYSPRAIATHSAIPPEAWIQLLKSPEQEMSPLSRPQVKLPFPLKHDCSANSGASGSKPLQFVVLPIVEPVAPLKPIFPKPPFLPGQYGQFPNIPPFNLFNKKPPAYPTGNGDGQGSSGQFVPILNRPAPPLPFVFVQSLPLELIGANMDLDVLNSSPSQTSETKINEAVPIAAPVPPSTSSTLQPSVQPVAPPPVTSESVPSPTRPLPLIVIEKVKTPGQPPSAPVAPGSTVVEISKQSIPKSGSGGSAPLSTISVIKPITAPGSEPHTPEQQQEIHKTIEKLVPVAAAVLDNVEKEEQKQQHKEGKDADVSMSSTVAPQVTSSAEPSTTVKSVENVKPVDQEKTASLRPPLRPSPTPEATVAPTKTEPMASASASEEIVGIGVHPTSGDVVITEA